MQTDHSGSALRVSIADGEPGFRDGRGADARARHRRQLDDLQLGQFGPARSDAGVGAHRASSCSSRTSTRATCCRVFRIPTTRTFRRAAKQVSGHYRLRRPVGRRRRRSRSRARVDRDRHGELLRRARRAGRRSAAASRPQEETPGAPATVVLSHAYWQRRFNQRSRA